jgi:cytochrome b6-f complex iron-sulfur subunit
LYMLYPNLSQATGAFGSAQTVGKRSDFKAATPTQFNLNSAGVYYIPVARTYLVHLSGDTKFLLSGTDLKDQQQSEWWVKDSDGTYWVALYQRCVHLGCTVPFRNDCYSFKCPCHGSHYNVDGAYTMPPPHSRSWRAPRRPA